MTKTTFTVLWLVLLQALTAGAEPAGPRGQAPRPPATASPTPGTQAVVPADYEIGPEDVLGVVFWREPELSGDVTVRPDGKITLPVIGTVQAAGVRPEALQEQVRIAASKYVAEPNVAVVVRTINSRKVFVTGLVRTPGAYPVIGPLSVLQAIALAGGLTEYADGKNITVIRNRNGRTETFRFNYKDVARGRGLDTNIQLRPGDTVVVP